MLRRLLLLTAIAVILRPASASAHATGFSYLSLTVEPNAVGVKVDLPWKDVAQPLGITPGPAGDDALLLWLDRTLIIEGDGRPCSPFGKSDASVSAEGTLTLRTHLSCSAGTQQLRVESLAGDTIGTGYSMFVELRRDGSATQRALLTGKDREHRFVAASPESSLHVALEFVQLGIRHILTGYDHMLFLLTILLLGGSLWRIVGLASAFTVAHTITLSLAATRTLQLPSRWPESAIAASIAYVALEDWIYARRRNPEPLAIRWRWLLTFAFGLIHGFGFASALAERGLPHEHLPLALGSFNAGVELGQIALIVAAYPILRWAARHAWYRPTGVRVVASVAFAFGLFWFVQRVAF